MTYLRQILKYKHIISISIAAIAIASYVIPIGHLFPFVKAISVGSVHQTSAQACIIGAYGGSCQNLNSQNIGSDIASNVIGIQSGSNPTVLGQNLNSQNAGSDIASNVIGIQSGSNPTVLDSLLTPITPRPTSETPEGVTPSTSKPLSTSEADGGADPTVEKDTNTNTNTAEKDTNTNTNTAEKDTKSNTNTAEKDTKSNTNTAEKDTKSNTNNNEKDTKNNRSKGEKDT